MCHIVAIIIIIIIVVNISITITCIKYITIIIIMFIIIIIIINHMFIIDRNDGGLQRVADQALVVGRRCGGLYRYSIA